MCVGVRVRAFVRACVRARVRTHACARVRVLVRQNSNGALTVQRVKQA